MTATLFPPAKTAALLARERTRFAAEHPKAQAVTKALQTHWLHGSPSHWMNDWAGQLVAAHGQGAALTDIDGRTYDDFCLGDTPAMFGHGRDELAAVLARQAAQGATFMLPTEEAAEVGALLTARFGLPFWQATLSASDANRAALRWARAITGRPRVLVFDGCYHGMVDESFVGLGNGAAHMDAGLVGQTHDITGAVRVAPFNDLAALEAALAHGDLAAILAEPALTNCGMILPDAGFHAAMRVLATQYGALLILDETHTLSTGPGGYTRAYDLSPDMLVVGKAIAGGFPAAVWGVTAEVADRIRAHPRGDGRSGIGTTLAGSALAIAAIGVMLREVITEATYARMLGTTDYLVRELERVIAARGAPWCVVHVGARAEIVFAPHPPRDAAAMRLAMADHALSEAMHLWLINRGVLIAPFHTMMLVSPATSAGQVDRLVSAIDAFLEEGAPTA